VDRPTVSAEVLPLPVVSLKSALNLVAVQSPAAILEKSAVVQLAVRPAPVVLAGSALASLAALLLPVALLATVVQRKAERKGKRKLKATLFRASCDWLLALESPLLAAIPHALKRRRRPKLLIGA